GASGVFLNSASTITVATDASGVAYASFKANTTPGGAYTVTAAAAGLTTVKFALTNIGETMLANTGSTPQAATAGTAFGKALAVTVKLGSTAVTGVSVTFTAPASGASGTFRNNTATITVATKPPGIAPAP